MYVDPRRLWPENPIAACAGIPADTTFVPPLSENKIAGPEIAQRRRRRADRVGNDGLRLAGSFHVAKRTVGSLLGIRCRYRGGYLRSHVVNVRSRWTQIARPAGQLAVGTRGRPANYWPYAGAIWSGIASDSPLHKARQRCGCALSFPTLLPYLEQAFEQAPEGGQWVVGRYRGVTPICERNCFAFFAELA